MSTPPITIDGTPVERVSNTKFLGVNITKDLTWTIHTQSVVRKAYQHLFFLRRLKKLRIKNRRRICHIHIHNYTEYNQQWNVFSAFNPSKWTHTHLEQWTHTHTHTHTWSSGQCLGSSRGFGALLKGLTSAVYNFCQSWDSNPQPWVKSPTLYPLSHGCPSVWAQIRSQKSRVQKSSDSSTVARWRAS